LGFAFSESSNSRLADASIHVQGLHIAVLPSPFPRFLVEGLLIEMNEFRKEKLSLMLHRQLSEQPIIAALDLNKLPTKE